MDSEVNSTAALRSALDELTLSNLRKKETIQSLRMKIASEERKQTEVLGRRLSDLDQRFKSRKAKFAELDATVKLKEAEETRIIDERKTLLSQHGPIDANLEDLERQAFEGRLDCIKKNSNMLERFCYFSEFVMDYNAEQNGAKFHGGLEKAKDKVAELEEAIEKAKTEREEKLKSIDDMAIDNEKRKKVERDIHNIQSENLKLEEKIAVLNASASYNDKDDE